MNGFTDKCPLHPAHPAWRCPPCNAATTPPPSGWRDDITLTRRTRPARRDTTPDTDRLEQVREQLDQQETP